MNVGAGGWLMSMERIKGAVSKQFHSQTGVGGKPSVW